MTLICQTEQETFDKTKQKYKTTVPTFGSWNWTKKTPKVTTNSQNNANVLIK